MEPGAPCRRFSRIISANVLTTAAGSRPIVLAAALPGAATIPAISTIVSALYGRDTTVVIATAVDRDDGAAAAPIEFRLAAGTGVGVWSESSVGRLRLPPPPPLLLSPPTPTIVLAAGVAATADGDCGEGGGRDACRVQRRSGGIGTWETRKKQRRRERWGKEVGQAGYGQPLDKDTVCLRSQRCKLVGKGVALAGPVAVLFAFRCPTPSFR
jgi:hypothetical protein